MKSLWAMSLAPICSTRWLLSVWPPSFTLAGHPRNTESRYRHHGHTDRVAADILHRPTGQTRQTSMEQRAYRAHQGRRFSGRLSRLHHLPDCHVVLRLAAAAQALPTHLALARSAVCEPPRRIMQHHAAWSTPPSDIFTPLRCAPPVGNVRHHFAAFGVILTLCR